MRKVLNMSVLIMRGHSKRNFDFKNRFKNYVELITKKYAADAYIRFVKKSFLKLF